MPWSTLRPLVPAAGTSNSAGDGSSLSGANTSTGVPNPRGGTGGPSQGVTTRAMLARIAGSSGAGGEDHTREGK
jgi:hypothetical protein